MWEGSLALIGGGQLLLALPKQHLGGVVGREGSLALSKEGLEVAFGFRRARTHDSSRRRLESCVCARRRAGGEGVAGQLAPGHR